MKQRLNNISLYQVVTVLWKLLLLFIASLPTIVLLLLPNIVVAFRLSHTPRSSLLSPNPQTMLLPTVVASPTAPNSTISGGSTTPLEDIRTEAQNDVAVANTVINFGVILFTVMGIGLGVASFLGVREFLSIRRLRTEVEVDIQRLSAEVEANIQRVTTIEKQFEDRVEKHADHFKRTSENYESRFKTGIQTLEKHIEQVAKYFESQTFIEASYNYGAATDAYEVGDNVRAIQYYLRVLQSQPNNKHVMERLGRAHSNLNEIEKAVEYLKKALAIDPSYVPALRSLALCYRYTNKEEAIKYLKQELAINPTDHEGWDFLGLFYRDQRLIDEAISAHQKALDIKKRPETEFYLSILFCQKGDIMAAKLAALSAHKDMLEQEHDLRIRPVWKILIHCGVYIIDDDKEEALRLIHTLTKYITTKRIFDAITAHLQFLLEASDHREWIPEFMDIVKLKET